MPDVRISRTLGVAWCRQEHALLSYPAGLVDNGGPHRATRKRHPCLRIRDSAERSYCGSRATGQFVNWSNCFMRRVSVILTDKRSRIDLNAPIASGRQRHEARRKKSAGAAPGGLPESVHQATNSVAHRPNPAQVAARLRFAARSYRFPRYSSPTFRWEPVVRPPRRARRDLGVASDPRRGVPMNAGVHLAGDSERIRAALNCIPADNRDTGPSDGDGHQVGTWRRRL